MPEQLEFKPAINHPELLSPSIPGFLKSWAGSTSVEEIKVAEINPEFSGSFEFCERYGISTEEGANCVILEAVRGEIQTIAACVVPIFCRADINSLARKQLNARKVSFAPLEKVIELTQMEYGSITPVGLPSDWPILIDSRIASMPHLIIGGGLRKSKLSLPGKVLAELPGAVVLENLGIPLPS
jgi:prolyl-tRNA editing enzyme YbaK/EbsC (Cys-tRNA(Pro) deacylase)